MKKGTITIIAIVAVVAIIVLWGIRVNNKLVTSDENVQKAWAQVENVYKRRADLIPQLVATVQGAANFEKGTLTEVIQARAGIDNAKVDPSQLTEEQVAAYQKAQDNLGKALANTIKVTVERYPELTATQGFRDLQVQLEGTENRINTERNNYNEAVQRYNVKIRRFPNSLLSGMFGFEKMQKFEAEAGAEKAPQVKF